jgi:multidrug resistance efflux pump
MCSEAAKEGQDAEAQKVSDAYDKKISAIQDKMEREQLELDKDEAEYSQRKMDELGSGLDTVMGLFGGRKRSFSKNLTKRRMTSTAKADVDESNKAIADYKKEIAGLEQERTNELQDIQKRWANIAGKSTEIKVMPLKKDVLLDFFGVAWFPYFLVQTADGPVELPGFKTE